MSASPLSLRTASSHSGLSYGNPALPYVLIFKQSVFCGCETASSAHPDRKIPRSPHIYPQRYGIAFLILGHPVRHRPHMLFNHVPFQRIQRKPIHRILHGDLRMVGAVRFLTGRFCAVIRICLIKIQVVQQSCSCGRNCIPMEKATQQIIVIRYIQAVLKSCRIPMVSELFQRLHISVFQDVGNQRIIRQTCQFFLRASCMKHTRHRPFSIAAHRFSICDMFSVTDFRGFVKAAANKAGKQILQESAQSPFLSKNSTKSVFVSCTTFPVML